ncbi:MAG: hypothetical protein AB1295_04240 [Candidatus Micrarchaeota archaeon]
MYELDFDNGWKKHFDDLPEDLKTRVVKKIKRALDGLPSRHFRFGVDFFVE